MSQSQQAGAVASSQIGRHQFEQDRAGDTAIIDTESLLELLGDKYARELLSELGDTPRSADELHERLDCSRPTVYRRLNALREAGVVESSLQLDPDGHHCEQFVLTLEQADLRFGQDGISVEV